MRRQLSRSGSLRSWRGALGALVACGVLVGMVAPTPAGADHSWGNYHWARTENPFALQLGDNVTSAWDPHLVTTSADWTSSSVLDTTIAAGGSNPKNCRATAGRVEVCNSKYGANGWLGLASVWVSGDHIAQGTVKLNDTYFNSATYNTPAWRNMVMCQEVGHTLGLAHVNEVFTNPNTGSCMDYTNAPGGGVVNNFDYGLSNERPNAHDYEQLASIYNHVEIASASATSPKGGGNNRADWGRAVSQDSKGRDDHFVRDLGNGEQVFTFVIWAD